MKKVKVTLQHPIDELEKRLHHTISQYKSAFQKKSHAKIFKQEMEKVDQLARVTYFEGL